MEIYPMPDRAEFDRKWEVRMGHSYASSELISTDWGFLSKDQIWTKMCEVASKSHNKNDLDILNTWMRYINLIPPPQPRPLPI